MGNIQKKGLINSIRKVGPLLFGLIVIFYFALPVFTKQAVIGPFDFLVNFYHPYKDLPWDKTPSLYAQYTKPKTYLMSDVVGVVFPMKYYTIESLKKGIIPLWNPAILNGAPHLANTQSSVLNPFNIVYILFGYIKGFNIFILLQPLLAFAGMYLFLRYLDVGRILSTLGGVSFALSGFMIVWLPWGTIGYAYAMLPWALYFLKKKFWWSLVPLTIAIFAGHIQTAFIIIVFFYIYALFQKIPLKKLLSHMVLLLFLGAPQLLPTIQLVKYSGRSTVSDLGFYLGQSLHFDQLINIFAPDYFGNPVTRNWWGQNNYAETVAFSGVLFFICAVINSWYALNALFRKEKRIPELLFFIGAALVSILLSMQNPLLYILYKLNIPIFSSSTFSRNLSILIFVNIVGGTLLLSKIQKNIISKQVIFKGLIVALLTIIGIWIYTVAFLPHWETAANVLVAKRNLILPTVFFFLYAALLVLIYTRLTKKLVFLLLAAILMLQVVDITRFAKKYTPFSPQEFFYPKTELGEYIKSNLSHKTYFNLVDSNLADIVHGETIVGMDPLFLQQYAEFVSTAQTGNPTIHDRTGVSLQKGPYFPRILDILGVQYIIDKNRDFQNSWETYNPKKSFETEMPNLWSDGIYQVDFNKSATKPFHLVAHDRVIVSNTDQQVLQILLSSQFNPQQDVVVEQTPTYPTVEKGAAYQNKVKDLQVSSQYQKLEVDAAKRSILVNNQTFYPNWRVRVDGQERLLLKVNYVLQGVALSPGKHLVEFYYEDRFFIVGCLLFIIGIIFLASKTITIAIPTKIIRSLRETLS